MYKVNKMLISYTISLPDRNLFFFFVKDSDYLYSPKHMPSIENTIIKNT